MHPCFPLRVVRCPPKWLALTEAARRAVHIEGLAAPEWWNVPDVGGVQGNSTAPMRAAIVLARDAR
jgi:hypothetical protein